MDMNLFRLGEMDKDEMAKKLAMGDQVAPSGGSMTNAVASGALGASKTIGDVFTNSAALDQKNAAAQAAAFELAQKMKQAGAQQSMGGQLNMTQLLAGLIGRK